MLTAIVQILVSLLPLFFGRQLFWLFVGVVGFFVGIVLGDAWFQANNQVVQLLIALGMGAAFAVLAIIIQRPMAMVAGFFALSSITLLLAGGFGFSGNGALLVALIAGVVGAVVVALTFDWALIVLSALNGAGGVSAGVLLLVPGLPQWAGVLLLLALAAVGIAFQSRGLEREPAQAY
jgi:hypothetical protein